MKQVLTLIKLEYLSDSKRFSSRPNIFATLLKWFITALFTTAIVYIALMLTQSLLNVCIMNEIQVEFVIFYIFIIQIIQLIFGLSVSTKKLFFDNDMHYITNIVPPTKIFLSKIIYLFIYEFIFSTVLALPVFIQYGVTLGYGSLYYISMCGLLLFLPIIPFLLSIILSVPIMFIIRALSNKFIIMLIIYIAFVAVGFYFYIQLLSFTMTFLGSQSSDILSNLNIIKSIKDFSVYLVIPLLLKNILLGTDFLKSFFILLAFSLAVIFIILFVVNKIYFKIIASNIEHNRPYFRKRTKTINRKPLKALLYKEFLSIFRSVNYSFQYLAIVITTPLMVYYCNVIVSKLATSKLGEAILPGVSVLVLLMFLSMGTSFAATSITREGDTFFRTKLIPISFTKQVLVKLLLYVIVAVPAVFISCLALAIFGFLNYLHAFLIAASTSLVVIGLIAKSINIDIKRPRFMYLGGKEVVKTNTNVGLSLSYGFIIATVVGVGSLFLAYILSFSAFYGTLFGFGVTFVIIELLQLFYKLESRYRNIEV